MIAGMREIMVKRVRTKNRKDDRERGSEEECEGKGSRGNAKGQEMERRRRNGIGEIRRERQKERIREKG